MPSAGQFVLNGEGKFVVDSQGRWRIFDEAGNCDPCCGGGDPGTSICQTRHPLQRTFVCPLNNQTTTLNARNSWSDSFAWSGDIAATALVPPPCDNHIRFTSGATNTVGATTILAPSVYGGANRLVVATGNPFLPNQGFSVELWNGGGQLLESVMQIRACRNLGNVGTVLRPSNMLIGIYLLSDGFIDLFPMGVVQSLPSSFAWSVDGQVIGPTRENDVIQINVSGNWARSRPSYALWSASVNWSITNTVGPAYSGSYQTAIEIFWSETTLPQCCAATHFAGVTTNSFVGPGVFDDYSGQVINPFNPV